jgi:hypothetical protein
MTDLSSILNQLTQKDVAAKLGKTVGARPEQVQDLVKLGLPTLVEALNKNAKTETGAKSLAKALDAHKDDGIDDLDGFLKGVDLEDGAKILGHVLGNKTTSVEQKLGVKTGLDASQVGGLLVQLAPLLMGMLGKQKSAQNVDASGLGGLLGGLLGGSGDMDLGKIASGFLDSDGDGDIMDNVGDLLGGFLKK